MNRIFFISAVLILTACVPGQHSPEEATTQSTEAENATQYDYEPVVSTLHGTLSMKQYWGPPGYGEDTTADEREQVYVLVLKKGIRMRAPKKDISDGYNGPIDHINSIQLVNHQKLEEYLNKPVTVTGTLFGAQTGHHHTDVLLDLQTIQ